MAKRGIFNVVASNFIKCHYDFKNRLTKNKQYLLFQMRGVLPEAYSIAQWCVSIAISGID